MAPKLYMKIRSPPCRAVLMVMKALAIEVEIIEINTDTSETLKPEFLKLNPQHTIPTLEDEGKIIWDSHAINIYLVSKYGKNDSLYPKDIYKRAIVDQRLHFDSGVVFPLDVQIKNTIVVKKLKVIPPNEIAAVEEAYGFLEKFLDGHQWVAGDDLTIADINLIPTITTLDFAISVDKQRYPNVVLWMKRAEALPFYDINLQGLAEVKKAFGDFVKL